MRRSAYYLVIDIEATCDKNDALPRHEKEIIEIGAVMVDASSLEMVDEFQSFVRPVRHPKLTPFCIDLTTIRQVEVDTSPRFGDVMREMNNWMRHFPNALFCSWGDYDRIQFEVDCRYNNVTYPFGRAHLNLKTKFAQKHCAGKPVGMRRAMRKMRLQPSGTLHRGIDDARNIARLMPFIM